MWYVCNKIWKIWMWRTMVKGINDMEYGVKEMNEMGFGLKETRWNVVLEVDNVTRERLRLSNYVMWCKPVAEQ